MRTHLAAPRRAAKVALKSFDPPNDMTPYNFVRIKNTRM